MARLPGVEAYTGSPGQGLSSGVGHALAARQDGRALARAVRETGAVVVCEEHISSGGLGSAVACAVAGQQPASIEYVNLGDTYAESGTPEELMEKYGLTAGDVIAAAERALERKSKI